MPPKIATATALIAVFAACSGKDDRADGYALDTSSTNTTGLQAASTTQALNSSSSSTTTGSISSTTGGISVDNTTGSAGGTGNSPDPACATESTVAELLPVYLVFGFDRSGSMGQEDYEWHDPALKWDPVSLATQSFFADPASMGLNASLTFFPRAGGSESRCESESYLEPDVPMTSLPATQFAEVLDQVPSEEWLGGTPTLAVMEGLIAYTQEQVAARPGRYAIVLVTDGYPQSCDDVTIEQVAQRAADVALNIPTYVIGIANPPIDGAPETVADLHQIAVAGGTQQAFLIDTGNPAATSAAFSAAVEQIRGSSIVCELGIPEPPTGTMFDKEKVAVTYTSSSTMALDQLVYDPDCTTQRGWHYDDPADPTLIQLCDAACAVVEADPGAALGVDFVCENILEIPQ